MEADTLDDHERAEARHAHRKVGSSSVDIGLVADIAGTGFAAAFRLDADMDLVHSFAGFLVPDMDLVRIVGNA